MEYAGIDLHKKESQICLLTEAGEVIERRIRTEPQRFADVLGGRPRARILVEASTESEWVARCLEALGHEVVVADPNFAPMYATRTRKVKTDRRDAWALQEACLLGPDSHQAPLSPPQPLLAFLPAARGDISGVTAHHRRTRMMSPGLERGPDRLPGRVAPLGCFHE
jgi:transposase